MLREAEMLESLAATRSEERRLLDAKVCKGGRGEGVPWGG